MLLAPRTKACAGLALQQYLLLGPALAFRYSHTPAHCHTYSHNACETQLADPYPQHHRGLKEL